MGEDSIAWCVHSLVPFFTALATLEPPAIQGIGIAGGETESLHHVQSHGHISSQLPRAPERPQHFLCTGSSAMLSFPSSNMQFILQYSVPQCSRAAVVLVQNCSHLPCQDIFGYSVTFKRKPGEWELEKSFVPWQRLIPNGQAGGSKGAGEAGLERCQSTTSWGICKQRKILRAFFILQKKTRKLAAWPEKISLVFCLF